MELKRSQKRILSVLIVVYILSPLIVPTYGATIWSESFDGPALNGWTTFGLNMTGDVPVEVPANYSLDDHNLRFTGEFETHAYHASAVSFGNWSFDVDAVDSELNHFYVAFMSAGIMNPDDLPASIPAQYGLMIVTGTFGSFDNEFVFFRRAAGSPDLAQVLDRYAVSDLSGWYHIRVSRDSSGNADVFINGTHRMEGLANMAVTSEYFAFTGAPGPAIDNIVVEDAATMTTTPTTPTTSTQVTGLPNPDMMLVILAIGAAIAVVVVVIVVMKRRS